MTISSVRVLAAVLIGLVTGVALGAAEPPIIAKARAYLGSESALNSIQSIHSVGTVVTVDPSDPAKQTRAAIEIIVQKPDQYRVTITSDKTIETTALNGYDGWSRITAANDPTKWQQTLQGAEAIKRLRANTAENIGFFRGIRLEGGTVEDEGPQTVDGVRCEKVAFVYARDTPLFRYFDVSGGRQIYSSPNIVYYRYFDLSSGKLIFSQTESGGTIREQGEIFNNGIRFPKSIITITKNPAGKSQTVTITFEKITLNEKFADSFFAVPSLLTH